MVEAGDGEPEEEEPEEERPEEEHSGENPEEDREVHTSFVSRFSTLSLTCVVPFLQTKGSLAGPKIGPPSFS